MLEQLGKGKRPHANAREKYECKHEQARTHARTHKHTHTTPIPPPPLSLLRVRCSNRRSNLVRTRVMRPNDSPSDANADFALRNGTRGGAGGSHGLHAVQLVAEETARNEAAYEEEFHGGR